MAVLVGFELAWAGGFLMVKVLFIADPGEMEKSLILKFLKQTADRLTDSAKQLGMGESFAVMVEDTQNHTSCGFATDEKMSMMLSTNFGSTYQSQKKNKLSEQQTTSPGTGEVVECKTPEACHYTVGTGKVPPFCMTCTPTSFGKLYDDASLSVQECGWACKCQDICERTGERLY